jgi:hypothetical protein
MTMRAKADHPFLRTHFPKAFEQFFESRTATKLAQLAGVEPSTITRERGPRLERYSAPELAEFLVDDLQGDRVLYGQLQAIALRRAGTASPEAGNWLIGELTAAVQEMLADAGKAVAVVADGQVDARERADLAKDLRALMGNLALVLDHLETAEADRATA